MRRNGLVSIVFTKTPPGTNYKPGSWSWVSESDSVEYIEEGYGREWRPDFEVITPTPTMSNTKVEICDYLDDNNIEYEEGLTKSELLDLA